MTTLSDLKEMKEALDAGLVSQADYDNVKRDYLRAQKEALVEFQKRELLAKEEFQKRKAEADLRAYALESIVKHGSSLMSEEQKVDLVRDYIRMSGLDPATTEKAGPSSKRQRIKAEPRDASPPQTAKPASTSAATNQAPGAPAPGTSTSGGGVLNEHILQILNMSGLDRGATERDASPPQPQPSTPPAPAAVPSYADAPIPADEDEYSNCSADAPRDDSDCVEPTTTKRREWTKDDDAALVSALRAGQKVSTIEIGGRSGGAASKRLSRAREDGTGSPALREYLEEYMCNSSHQQKTNGWSAEEEETFIRAHKEGKLLKEIAAMLPGRTKSALRTRWYEAKIGKAGTAALKAYAAECATAKGSSWSVEEEQTTIRAHKKGKTFQEIAAMLPGRTEIAVGARWSLAKSGRYGSAALREYAAECTPEKSPWSVEEDHTFIKSPQEGQNNEGDRCNVTRENRMCCAAKMA